MGLFQVFELGLLEIKAHRRSTRCAYPGGQCVELYRDKPIYDIPGTPVRTGRDLTDSLLKQIAPFRPHFHFGEQVATLARQDDGRLLLGTAKGTLFLRQDRVHRRRRRRLRAASASPSKASSSSKARGFSTTPMRSIALPAKSWWSTAATMPRWTPRWRSLPRREAGHAAASPRRLPGRGRHRRGAARARRRRRHAVGQVGPAGRLRRRPICRSPRLTPQTRRAALRRLIGCLGISPRLGPIADWGLDLERKQVPVDTEKYETRERGVFAVGDINTYPGKKKLIVCGFHEATLAAWGATAIVFPDKSIPLQYTTTSTRLHTLLGVDALTRPTEPRTQIVANLNGREHHDSCWGHAAGLRIARMQALNISLFQWLAAGNTPDRTVPVACDADRREERPGLCVAIMGVGRMATSRATAAYAMGDAGRCRRRCAGGARAGGGHQPVPPLRRSD